MSQIIPIIKKDKELSKEEASFNNLVLKIANAHESIEKTKALLEGKRRIAEEQLRPIVNQQIELRLKLFGIYWDAYNEKRGKKSNDLLPYFLFFEVTYIRLHYRNLSAKDNEYLNGIYQELSTKIYDVKDIEEEEDNFENNDWNFLDDEELQEYLEELKDQYFWDGIDLDISGLNFEMPFEELRATLDNRIREAEAIAETQRKERENTKKKSKKVGSEINKEEAKKKDVSTIYKSLAKIVHPDLETDPEERLKKEEFMKRVNQAYTNNDLYSLLALEQELIDNGAERLNELSEVQIKVYIQAFKEQLEELKTREAQLFYRPEYQFLRGYVDNAFSLKIWKPEKQVQISTKDLKQLETYHQLASASKKGREVVIKTVLAMYKKKNSW